VISWIIGVSFVSGICLFILERNNPAFAAVPTEELFLDCCFVALNGVTATGLASIDITQMSGASQFIIMLAMQLGSATMLTLCPVYIRMRSLRRAVRPASCDGFCLWDAS
jgi:Trk-type K+ transport system membrane component